MRNFPEMWLGKWDLKLCRSEELWADMFIQNSPKWLITEEAPPHPGKVPALSRCRVTTWFPKAGSKVKHQLVWQMSRRNVPKFVLRVCTTPQFIYFNFFYILFCSPYLVSCVPSLRRCCQSPLKSTQAPDISGGIGVCGQKGLSGGPLSSGRGGSGPQLAWSGLQEAIRGLRQDALQIQLGRAGFWVRACCQSERRRAGV